MVQVWMILLRQNAKGRPNHIWVSLRVHLKNFV